MKAALINETRIRKRLTRALIPLTHARERETRTPHPLQAGRVAPTDTCIPLEDARVHAIHPPFPASREIATSEQNPELRCTAEVYSVMTTHVGMLLYPGLTQLDLTGPFELLQHLPASKIHLVWKDTKPVFADSGLGLLPTTTLAEARPMDLLFVPGGAQDRSTSRATPTCSNFSGSKGRMHGT